MKNSTRTGEPEAVAVQIAEEPLKFAPLAIFMETVLPEGGGSGGGVVAAGILQASFVYAESPALLNARTR